MEAYKVAVLVIAGLNAVAVPFIKSLLNRLKEMEKETQEFKLHVAKQYVTKDEMKDRLERIEKGIDDLKKLLVKRSV